MTSVCGEYVGEALVSDDGTFLGDFTQGDGRDAPLGWSRSMGYWWGMYKPWCPSAGVTFQCSSLYQWLFAPWWDPPYVFDFCIGIPQPRVPISSFGTTFTGMLNSQTVTDTSGPPHLTAVPALQLDLAGSGHGSLSFIGEQASLHAGYDPADYDTAWFPDIGSRWVWQVWAKVVPDANDYTIPDGHLSFGYGRENTETIVPTPAPDDDTLTTDWKFFQTAFTVTPWLSDAHHAIPFISVRSEDAVLREERPIVLFCKEMLLTKWAPKGRVAFKCAHLYPEDAPQLGVGNWCDSFHGHG